jgi:transcriptional regulator with XRE-family HTH domain
MAAFNAGNLGVPAGKEERAINAEADAWALAARTVLKHLRIDADVSQQEQADRIGWTAAMVANLERGRKVVDIRDIPRIASAMDADAASIFEEIIALFLKRAKRLPSARNK